MGKTNDKKRKQDRLDKVLAKKKQNDLKKFLECDPYLAKSAHFEAAREELDKMKGKNDGINNYRGNANRRNRDAERRAERTKIGMFGQIKD